MPSPLDRPGLDDPPLREWVVDAEDGDSLGLGEAHARALRELNKKRAKLSRLRALTHVFTKTWARAACASLGPRDHILIKI